MGIRGRSKTRREICSRRLHWLTEENIVWQKKTLKGGIEEWYRACKICKRERNKLYMRRIAKTPNPNWRVKEESTRLVQINKNRGSKRRYVTETVVVGTFFASDPNELVGGIKEKPHNKRRNAREKAPQTGNDARATMGSQFRDTRQAQQDIREAQDA